MQENYRDYLSGRSLIDLNANYSEDIANIRRQLACDSETKFNLAFIKENFKHSNELLDLHNSEIYVHDLTKIILLNYCYAPSTLTILENGIQYYDDFQSKLPKRLDSFIAQLIEVSTYLANRQSGALAFPDLIVPISNFVKKNNLSTFELTEQLQHLFYSFNQSLRQGAESIFSNLSFFDSYYIKHLFEDILPQYNLKTDDLLKIQEKVMKWHTKETEKIILRFPVLTICLARENGTVKDTDFLKFVCEQNIKHTQYNFLALEDLKSIASCCRLLSSNNSFINSYGSGSISIGSHKVVTLSLPGTYIRNKSNFEEKLKENLILVKEFLDWHRKLIKKYSYLDKSYEVGLKNINRMFSTVGIIGIWDLKCITGFSWDYIYDLISSLKDEINSWSGSYNFELVPAETAAISLFNCDREYVHSHELQIDHYNQASLYANQVISTASSLNIGEKAAITGRFAKNFSGGSMMFFSVGSKFQTTHQMKKVILGMVKNEVPYFAVDTYISRCKERNHVTLGDVEVCPFCGSFFIEKFRRIVGYFVNIKNFHDRKEKDLAYRFNVT